MSQFLLIHGGFHGAWCWYKVVAELEKRGHRSQAIDLPGQGSDRTPIAEITLNSTAERVVAALVAMSEDTIVVRHSSGGMVISAAAEMAPSRIKKLIYLSAFLPRDGESLLAILAIEELKQRTAVSENIIIDDHHITGMIKLERVHDLFYHDCTQADIEYAKRRLRPQALAARATPVSLSAERFGSVKRGYIECTEDRALAIEIQRHLIAKSPPIDVRTLPSSHSPFFSMPDKLADTLTDLAR